MTEHYPKITITFPIYNGGNQPLKCLSSIQKLNYPPKQIEVIVVDNASTDRSSSQIEKSYPKIHLIRNSKNFGFAKAINIGIKKAKGEYIFITNDDIIFEKNSLKILVSYAEKHKNCILGGKQLHPQTKKFITGGRRFNFLTGMQTTMKNVSTPINCDQVDGCAMLIPKKLFATLGLFDEEFYPVYGEDLDLCLRAKKNNIDIIYHPKAIFFHNPSQTVSKLPLHDVYYFGFKNKLRLMLKHASLFQLFFFFLFHYLLTMPIRIIINKEPIFLPELNALTWNFKNLKKTLAKRK